MIKNLECKCNNCKKNIEEEIRRYFWEDIPEGSYFDFSCPYCDHSNKIEIEPYPLFEILDEERASEIL